MHIHVISTIFECENIVVKTKDDKNDFYFVYKNQIIDIIKVGISHLKFCTIQKKQSTNDVLAIFHFTNDFEREGHIIGCTRCPKDVKIVGTS